MSKFTDLIHSDKPVLVDFFAEWCGPCKTMAPILKDVVSQVGDNARIIKVDVDKNPAAATAYGVRSVPTLILFKGGKVVWQQSGVTPASALLKIISQFA